MGAIRGTDLLLWASVDYILSVSFLESTFLRRNLSEQPMRQVKVLVDAKALWSMIEMRGITPHRLSVMSGVNKGTISKLINEEICNPVKIETVKKIAKALEIPWQALCGW